VFGGAEALVAVLESAGGLGGKSNPENLDARGAITVRPSSATSTPSAYSLASSGKHQASATEASTTIPVKIVALR